MVKILEEVEEDRSDSTSRRMSLDTSPPHTPSPRPSTSSSHYYPQYLLSSPPPSHLSPLQPGSPDSSSSISSAHTFHGFSAKPSPLSTPTHPPEPHQSPFSAAISPNPSPSPPLLRPMISKKAPVFNRLVRDEPPASVAKTEPLAVTGFADAGGTTDYESGMDGSVGGEEIREGRGRRGTSPLSSSITRRATTVIAARKAALVLRWLEFAVCLVSFSVMTADRNRGWALDSFDRYKEFSRSGIETIVVEKMEGSSGDPAKASAPCIVVSETMTNTSSTMLPTVNNPPNDENLAGSSSTKTLIINPQNLSEEEDCNDSPVMEMDEMVEDDEDDNEEDPSEEEFAIYEDEGEEIQVEGDLPYVFPEEMGDILPLPNQNEPLFSEAELDAFLNAEPSTDDINSPTQDASFHSIQNSLISSSSMVNKLGGLGMNQLHNSTSNSGKRKSNDGVDDTATSDLMGVKKPRF